MTRSSVQVPLPTPSEATSQATSLHLHGTAADEAQAWEELAVDAGGAIAVPGDEGGARAVRSSARLSAAVALEPGARAPRRPSPGAAALRRARAAERAREVEDAPRLLRDKCRRLARALRDAKHLVVYTGAGISTAADIPDYRGPSGVWTRLQRGESVAQVEVSRARPTYTHMALTALWARGLLKFVVSQNCDGLHLRAGLPRRALAELHGDMYAERCPSCRAVYLRRGDVTERTARHRHGTRRLCHACGAELRDTIVHFGERGCAAWPLNWAGALRHADRADVVLCLGSSLKVLRRYARLWRMQAPRARRPRLYIVNLQWTPKDSQAALKINARCDDVMRALARRLRLPVPRYEPARDPLLAHAEPLAPPEQHTTRRARLHSASASASSGDSDDELPLRRLADRLRTAVPPLTSFRVKLESGDATILLRAEHARAPPPSDLRGVRIARHAAAAAAAGPAPEDSLAAAIFARAVLLCRAELYPGLHTILGPRPPPAAPPSPPAPAPTPPPPPVPAEAECAWCARVMRSPRCQWYGPPRLTPLGARAWRREGARRYLCACCGEAGAGTRGGGAGAGAEDADGGGWYGKGWRKGRRRR